VTTLLEGKTLAAQIRQEVAEGVQKVLAAGGRRPGLTAVLVGEDAASQAYVRSKTKGCEEAGIAGHTLRLPATTTAAELTSHIERLNGDDAVDGILVQLPLPSGLPEREILDLVDVAKDVDGFHPENVGKVAMGDPTGFRPATPYGVQQLLIRGGVVAIAEIDTRRLTRVLREKGAQAGCIASGEAAMRAA